MSKLKETNRLFRVLKKNSAVQPDNSDFDCEFVNRDWRRYIPEAMRNEWGLLTPESKRIAFVVAELQARTEPYKDPPKIRRGDLLPDDLQEKLNRRK